MVIGLDSFVAWFRGYEAYYSVIGGTACDLLLSEIGVEFRVTRDIDMVLIAETLDTEFGFRFWEYIKMAGYGQRFKSTGRPIYYRFTNPKSSGYPAMIELFSRRIEGILLPPDAILTPLPIGDDVSSLSAILLDDEYYDFLQSGVTLVDGVTILGATHMIPFKAKAWLDLTERKAKSGRVDSKDIRKHKNDVIRLSELLLPNVVSPLPITIMNDMRTFLAEVEEPHRYSRAAAAYGLSDIVAQS
jgi:hypothetical protein